MLTSWRGAGRQILGSSLPEGVRLVAKLGFPRLLKYKKIKVRAPRTPTGLGLRRFDDAMRKGRDRVK